jgi:hypothetical protein
MAVPTDARLDDTRLEDGGSSNLDKYNLAKIGHFLQRRFWNDNRL